MWYYRVCAYKTAGGQRRYGSYSSIAGAKAKLKTTSVILKKANSEKATIKWKKVAGAGGYQIQMSDKSKTSGFKMIKDIKKKSIVSYKKNGLKKSKRYYFRVRAYRIVSGKKNYGLWSPPKGIKL